MEDTVLQIAALLLGGFSSALWAHYFVTRRSSGDKESKLENRIVAIENTMVREHNVKQLVDHSIELSITPMYKVILELKDLVAKMQHDVTEIRLNEARREGEEAAMAKLRREQKDDR